MDGVENSKMTVVRFFSIIFICDKTKICTQVHVGGFEAMGVWDILVDGVQDLLLHLAYGITVQHLYLDLWALLILWMDTVHHL